MSTIQYLFQQFELAEAAYADLWATETLSAITDQGDVKSAMMEEGMSDTQATDLLNHWDVIDHVPDLVSGFSATIFREQ